MTIRWNGSTPALANKLAQMPKVELHLHLDGAPRWSALRTALDRHYGTILPEVPHWYGPQFRFTSFAEFGALFRQYTHAWLQASDGYRELTQEVFDSLIAQRIRYAEINFNVRLVEQFGYHFESVLEMLTAEVERAKNQGTIVRLFAGISRDKGVEQAAAWVQRLVSVPLFAGFDLHGIETGWSAKLFRDAFAPVREATRS